MVGRTRKVAGGVLLVGGVIWLVHTFFGEVAQVYARTAGFDFHDYYYSTKAFRFQHASIYDHAATDALSRKEQGTPWVPPYVYPPYLTVLFLPLVGLPFETARVLWLVLCYVFLFASFDAMSRLCALAGKRPVPWELRWLAPVFAVNLAPVREHNWYGQTNLLVLVLVCWGAYLEWRRPTRAPVGALLVAAAGLLKLFPLFLFPSYLASRQYRTAISIAAWAVALTAVTLLFVPLHEFLRFPEVLNASSYVASSQVHVAVDQSASSVLRYFFLPAAAPALAVLAVRAVPYAGYLAVSTREGRGGSPDVARLLRFSQGFVLLSFVMFRWWEHHFVMSLFPYFVAAYAASLPLPRARVLRPVLVAALVGSVAYFGAIRHPELTPWLARHFEAPMPGKFFSQLVLLGVLEALIHAHRRAESLTESAAD